MTDRFEVPEELVRENLYVFPKVDVEDIPALVRAEVERGFQEMRVRRGGNDELYPHEVAYLDARYGPAGTALVNRDSNFVSRYGVSNAAKAPKTPAPSPVFTREAAAWLEALARSVDAHKSDRFEQQKMEYREAARAYLKSIGRVQ